MGGGTNITDIQTILMNISKTLDAPIKSYIKDGTPSNLIEAIRQYPYAGGKRIRPSMILATCGAVGGKKEKAIPLAVAMEYIHNFTLIHDDLMDGDEKRRGMMTSHVKYGMQTAILAGDALFAKAFNIISQLDVPDAIMRKIMKIITTMVWDLARGQQMDINNEKRKSVTIDEYIETVRLKTGVMFAACTSSGAVIGGASNDVVEDVQEYAISLGIAFQMFDDVLGMIGDPARIGKSASNDIRRGKNTIIVCHALKNIKDPEDMEKFMSIFGKLNASEDEVTCVRKILEKTGSIDYAIEMAKKYTENAIKKLECLGPSEDKDFMIALAKFAMDRSA
ncbi:MAG: polyprenyl synthetase family protein [archaeon]|nr:polyprenyl synthetase family protein [archaeon]